MLACLKYKFKVPVSSVSVSFGYLCWGPGRVDNDQLPK